MEPQKYYNYSNNVYCVHFANRNGLSIEEITEIFSAFGYVVGVSKAGDDFGYRFVKYRDEEEVLRCVEGMRKHPFIRLKVKDPNRDKTGHRANNYDTSNGQKNYNNDRQRSESRDNNNRRSFETPTARTSVKSPENSSRNLSSNNPTANFKNNSVGEQKQNDAQNAVVDTKHVETKVNKVPDVRGASFETAKPVMPLRQPEVAAETFMPVCAKPSIPETVKNSEKPLDTLSEAKKYFTGKSLIYKQQIAAKDLGAVAPLIIPESAVPVVTPDAAAAEIPRLVEKNSASRRAKDNRGEKILEPAAEDENPTVTAEEVVVANIHSDFGVHYILHLIQKHDPLCVSEMKMIPALGLRYCIVYLQSLHQANAIEKELDRFQLCGKDLIVLRSQRLMELTAVA